MKKDVFSEAAVYGLITKTLLIVCVALFVFEYLKMDFDAETSISGALMYDSPKNPRNYWRGMYHEILANSRSHFKSFSYNTPMFEKILDGEIWRLFTPAILHGGLLHICFNLLWLHTLGRQMEIRLGIFRYSLFILIAALISNLGQYLMSGYNFVGLSGVICAMIMFIWTKMNIAAWEGYQIQRSTMSFIAVFILGLAGLQAIVFSLQLLGGPPFSFGIANTAHITGGIVGGVLAHAKIFSSRHSFYR